MELAERVAGLSDFQAVVACEDLAAALAARSEVPLADVVDQMPSELRSEIDPQALKEDLDERYHVALPPEVSIRLARAMLAVAAEDPVMAPLLVKVLDETQDTKQFALSVLAVGAAISMVITASTTTKGKDGWGKQALSPELAEKFTGWLKELKPWVGGGQSG
jgi:hypothetical protein